MKIFMHLSSPCWRMSGGRAVWPGDTGMPESCLQLTTIHMFLKRNTKKLRQVNAIIFRPWSKPQCAPLALMTLEGPRGAGRSIGRGLLSPRPLSGSGWLSKRLETIWGGKLWPWPYLASVGYGQRESYHPIENWIDSVLARDQLSCGFRVQVGGGGSEPWDSFSQQ